jgi:hypothetical protein
MKNRRLHILVTIGYLSLLQSCDLGRYSLETYQIKNASDYEITIKSYAHENLSRNEEYELNESIQLLPENGFWESSERETTRGGSMYYYLGDSIVIDFNEDRRIIYTYRDNSLPRHLYNFNSNYSKEVNDNKTTFTYTFTNDDYESAEDIISE